MATFAAKTSSTARGRKMFEKRADSVCYFSTLHAALLQLLRFALQTKQCT